MKILGTNISMIRSDSESITVSMKDKEGIEIPLTEGDTIYFTVKTSVRTEKIELQKVITEFANGKAEIGIYPEDTKSMNFGKYVYDIQLTAADGTVTTIIPPSIFEVRGEVTYE